MTYSYVEILRAKRALVVALILVGLFFLTAAAVRLSLHGQTWWTTGFDTSPTAHIMQTRLPDGTLRTVVDDPKQRTHAVILRRPDGSASIDATQPASAHDRDSGSSIVMGSSSLNQTREGDTIHVVGRYVPQRPAYPLGMLFMISIPMGLIVASMLSGVLSKENDGHLELAWTKPVTRERYAVGAMAVDAAAIVASQLLCIAVGLLATLMFFVPRFSYGPNAGWAIVLALAAPIAWYALITAASASLKRGPGMVIGLGWVAALIVPGVAAALQTAAGYNAVAAAFYAIFHALQYIDPIAYMGFRNNGPTLMPWAPSAGAVCLLVAIYLSLAVAQWRRVEA